MWDKETFCAEAYRGGWNAAEEGWKFIDNPYENNDLRTAWSDGFNDQKEDERDRYAGER